MTEPDRDREYLAKLQDYYARHRGLPSYTRLSEVLGLAAKSAVKKVLERLMEQGYLERTPDEVWVPTRRFFERPLAESRVPAGTPALTDDVASTPFLIDAFLIRQPSNTTLVPVKGDSMLEAGINDGDVVVVERGRAAKDGDIVVAIVDNEFTLKYLAKERDQLVLKPANGAYPTIRPKGELEVFGVVVGLFRRYPG